jgi:hypothetical protein
VLSIHNLPINVNPEGGGCRQGMGIWHFYTQKIWTKHVRSEISKFPTLWWVYNVNILTLGIIEHVKSPPLAPQPPSGLTFHLCNVLNFLTTSVASVLSPLEFKAILHAYEDFMVVLLDEHNRWEDILLVLLTLRPPFVTFDMLLKSLRTSLVRKLKTLKLLIQKEEYICQMPRHLNR